MEKMFSNKFALWGMDAQDTSWRQRKAGSHTIVGLICRRMEQEEWHRT